MRSLLTSRVMIKCLLIGISALAVSSALLLVQCRPAATGTRIVLITLDTLRYDGVFPAETQPSAMPLLRNRARGGTRFDRFYSTTSVTQPTHASLFTSQPPWEHGVTRNGQILSADQVTLAELLRDAGYQTHAVVASFPLSKRFGFGQGFDHYVEEFTRGEMEKWNAFEVPEMKFFTLADKLTDRAIEQISTASGDLQFFWFHYFDPHAPYGVTGDEPFSKAQIFAALDGEKETTERLLGRARRLYELDLAYLDASLDRLFDRLDADSRRFATHIFVTSDHGESFGELGSVGHGDRLSAAEIHVPAFLISPGLTPGRRDDVAGAIDVAPTLLSLAGLTSAASGLAGRDLTATGEQSPGIWGMRKTSARKRLREKRLDGQTYTLPKFWFYTVDPRGQIHRGNARRVKRADGAQDEPSVEHLEARFASFEARIKAKQEDAELDPESKAGLEALGYLP